MGLLYLYLKIKVTVFFEMLHPALKIKVCSLFTKLHGVMHKQIKQHLTASIGAPVLVQRDGPHHWSSRPLPCLLLFPQLLPSIFVQSVLLQQPSLAASPEVSYIPETRTEFAQQSHEGK
jgi:hypothetical protein